MIDLEQTIRNLLKCESAQSCCDAVGAIGSSLGLDYYLWGSFPSSNVIDLTLVNGVVTHNFPKRLVAQYRAGDYAKTDPVLRALRTRKEPIIWNCAKASVNGKRVDSGICTAAYEAGISHGITIPLASMDDEFAFMLWGSSVQAATVSSNASLQTSDVVSCLELIAEVFQLRVYHVLKREALIHRAGIGDVRLSSRERQVLSWVARGKTASEIGLILALSPKTIEHYLCNAMEKLNSANRTQAAVRAIECELISGEFEPL